MNKLNVEAFTYNTLKSLVEDSANHAGEAPSALSAPSVVTSSVTSRKKSNRSAKREESGQMVLLKNRIELMQSTIINLESENASLRRDLEVERKELRTLTSTLLSLNQDFSTAPHPLERKLETTPSVELTRPLTSRSVILIVAALAFLIMQLVLLIYADGYLFAL
ncbi:MAG: hypothetical protein ACKN9W_13110 [Methylococcus sp.]